jgi:hypothetical protein
MEYATKRFRILKGQQHAVQKTLVFAIKKLTLQVNGKDNHAGLNAIQHIGIF